MATPVFCCGFECGSGGHWASFSGAGFSTSTVRTGTRSLRVNPTATYSVADVQSGVITSSNNFVIRFYVYFATLPNVNSSIGGCVSGGRTRGVVFKSSDNSIYAGGSNGSNTFSFGATGIAITTGVWYRIDVKVDISANPHLVDVSVNGVNCTQYSEAIAASTSSTIRLSSYESASYSGTYDAYYDDLIVSNTLADYPIGAGYVNHFVPTSDGTHNVAGAADFRKTLTGVDITNATTDAYTLVDNIPLDSGAAASVGTFVNMIAPPNATDYVECIFGPAPGISTPTTAPRAVEMIAAIAQAGTGTGNMAILLRDNATSGTIYTATGVAGVTSYAYKRVHFATPPSGGSWGIAGGNGNFNALRVRYGSPAALDVNPDQYFAATMIEAEFAVASIPNKIVNINQAVKRAAYW